MASASSTPPLRFQIASDIHLETPLQSPSYAHFSLPQNFPIHAPHLFLLGDIGLAKHPQLFAFLSASLTHHPALTVYYVFGNHEAYGTNIDVALSRFEDYERECDGKFTLEEGGVGKKRFYFMHRRRVDLGHVTVLGCTLWTHIPETHAHLLATSLTDFNETNGIWDRTIAEHNAAHQQDLDWLNTSLASVPPDRDILILTHHSPTSDPRANNPRDAKSQMNPGFVTDLSQEKCWTHARVKMWAFGHTHYDCQFVDEDESGRRKLVVANQKGYAYPGGPGPGRVAGVVVEAGDGVEGGKEWKVVLGVKERGEERAGKIKVNVRGELGQREDGASTVMSTVDANSGSGKQKEEATHDAVVPPVQKSSGWRTATAKVKKILGSK